MTTDPVDPAELIDAIWLSKLARVLGFDLTGAVCGWADSSDTWVYVSAASFKVAGADVRARYPVGAKLSCTDGGVTKYFYVISTSYAASDTTVGITGGSTYSLAGGAITNPRFSLADHPYGFPHWFAWTPSWTNLTIGNAVQYSRFHLSGRIVNFTLRAILGNSSSVAVGIPGPIFTLPIAQGAAGDAYQKFADGRLIDTNMGVQYLGCAVINSSTTGLLRMGLDTVAGLCESPVEATHPMAWTTDDVIDLRGSYEI